MKTFELKVYDNYHLFFHLVLTKTRRQMLNAAHKKFPECKKNEKNTAGIFYDTSYITHKEIPGKFRSNYIGTMYLNLDDIKINPEIVTHECAHAAFSFQHFVLRYTGSFNSCINHGEFSFLGGGDSQEMFCYFLENACKKVWQETKQYKKELKNG